MKKIITRIRESLRKGELIVFLAECQINYKGRAESRLERGERLIIIKKDGTLLVHQQEGSQPVNYMKRGSVHKFVRDECCALIKSRNAATGEEMKIRLFNVLFIESRMPVDNSRITVMGTERHMADMIYNNPGLIEEGFKPLSREEHTKYGFIDVFGYDRRGRLVVIECKRDRADFRAVEQLRRYVGRIARLKGIEKKKVRGIIASPSISSNAYYFLEKEGFEYKGISPPHKSPSLPGQKKITSFNNSNAHS